MRQSPAVTIVVAMALSLSAALILQSTVWAQGVPPANQGTTSPTPTPSPSVEGAIGQIQTDTGKTTDDVKALDVNKAEQDAGQVKQDVQGLEDNTKSLEDGAKGLLSNPFSK